MQKESSENGEFGMTLRHAPYSRWLIFLPVLACLTVAACNLLFVRLSVAYAFPTVAVIVAVLWVFAWWFDSSVRIEVNAAGITNRYPLWRTKVRWEKIANFYLAPHPFRKTCITLSVGRLTIFVIPLFAGDSATDPTPAQIWEKFQHFARPSREQQYEHVFAKEPYPELSVPTFAKTLLAVTIWTVLGVGGATIALWKWIAPGHHNAGLLIQAALILPASMLVVVYTILAYLSHPPNLKKVLISPLSVAVKRKTWEQYPWDTITVDVLQRDGKPLPPSPEISIHLPDTKKPIRITPAMRNYTLFVMLLKRLKKIPE